MKRGDWGDEKHVSVFQITGQVQSEGTSLSGPAAQDMADEEEEAIGQTRTKPQIKIRPRQKAQIKPRMKLKVKVKRTIYLMNILKMLEIRKNTKICLQRIKIKCYWITRKSGMKI